MYSVLSNQVCVRPISDHITTSVQSSNDKRCVEREVGIHERVEVGHGVCSDLQCGHSSSCNDYNRDII